MAKLIYVAHPFTGEEEDNIQKARNICRHIQMMGALTINPLDMFSTSPESEFMYGEYLKACLRVMRVCDAVFLSPGWENSRGCRIEQVNAEAHQQPIFELFIRLQEFINSKP